jgi:hypothetical protein
LTVLVLLLKKLLIINELNISFYGILKWQIYRKLLGGLCSYVLILMVAAFLRICPDCTSIGHSFLEILRYYSNDFDYETMFIDRGEVIVLMSSEYQKLDNLFVVDPFRVGVNSARNLTRFNEIKELFNKSYMKIKDCIEKYESGEQIANILDKIYDKQPHEKEPFVA